MLSEFVASQDSSVQTVQAMAEAVGVPLSEQESADLVAGLQALAKDMISLDALDLHDVEPAPIFRARPQADRR
ncbi:MAG: hypothetical protein CL694_04630 [Chloroflexi bacterium]|nr:hypothetical protein [Chloroflexota bacterium]MDP6421295.1 hypothetical protein [SAR202 cluster bacterium]HAL46706.1 hypothetical protein [Dehalococcoidia bacterium]MDP6664073.1 hypothetical protein [SAR202 cluster bacterium]MDP6799527.1 hypothetical protein [SAR202 cluster bacterium]